MENMEVAVFKRYWGGKINAAVITFQRSAVLP